MKIKDGNSVNFANAFKAPFSDAVDLYLANKYPDGKISVCSGMVFTMYQGQEGQIVNPPSSIKLNNDSAAILMNALWNIGIRPSHEAQSVGQLAAIEKHLKDMRRIAFKAIKTDEP